MPKIRPTQILERQPRHESAAPRTLRTPPPHHTTGAGKHNRTTPRPSATRRRGTHTPRGRADRPARRAAPPRAPRHRRAARARAATRHDTARQTPRRHPHVGLRTRPAARRHTPRHRRQGPAYDSTSTPRPPRSRTCTKPTPGDTAPADGTPRRRRPRRRPPARPVPLLPEIHEPRGTRDRARLARIGREAMAMAREATGQVVDTQGKRGITSPRGYARTAKGTTSHLATRGRGTPPPSG